jgi:hypothetical protein
MRDRISSDLIRYRGKGAGRGKYHVSNDLHDDASNDDLNSGSNNDSNSNNELNDKIINDLDEEPDSIIQRDAIKKLCQDSDKIFGLIIDLIKSKV